MGRAPLVASLLAVWSCSSTVLPVGPVDGGARREAGVVVAARADAAPTDDAVVGPAPVDAAPEDDAALVDASAADAAAADAAPADAAAPERALFVAPTGDDANPGTRGAPLATIAEGLRRAQPGETVRVSAGTYRELVTFPRSGAPGQPITLAAVEGERVVLDGTGLGRNLPLPGLVTVADVSHVVVRGLEVTGLVGANDNFPAGIWVYGVTRDVRIERNVVRGIRAANGGRDSGAHGIGVYGLEPAPSEDIVVEGNVLSDLSLGYSEAIAINGNVRRFAVLRNTVHDVDNIAIDAIGFEEDVCPACTQADVIADDVNRARAGLIAENLTFDMSTVANPAYRGERAAACLYVDGGADIVIERNIAHHCDLGVELASEHFGKATRRVIVRSNFLFGHAVTGIATGGYDPGVGPGGGSAEDCVVVHNTVFDSARDGWADAALLLQNRNVRNTYKNNVLVASAGTWAIASVGALNFDVELDGNITFGGGVLGVLEGPASRSVDPRLVDPLQGNLHLAAGSPALGGGVPLDPAVLGALDVDGDPRVVGALDVGADER